MNLTRIAKLKNHCDFNYFTANYVKILHPKKGLINFELYDFQNRLVEMYNKNRFVITTKFRKSGVTTLSCIWALWQCMFKPNQNIMIASINRQMAKNTQQIVELAIKILPIWMMPQISKITENSIYFTKTNCNLHFDTLLDAGKNLKIDKLIVDEAAFHKEIRWPILPYNGKCFLISTTNGVNNWFAKIYSDAQEGKNMYKIFRANYTEHPDYQNKEKLLELREALGKIGWQQEILQNFVL